MNSSKRQVFDWRLDLEASRDLSGSEKKAFEVFLNWFEQWRLSASCEPSVETGRQFWKVQVLSKERKEWQLNQWAEAMRWYLQKG